MGFFWCCLAPDLLEHPTFLSKVARWHRGDRRTELFLTGCEALHGVKSNFTNVMFDPFGVNFGSC